MSRDQFGDNEMPEPPMQWLIVVSFNLKMSLYNMNFLLVRSSFEWLIEIRAE